MRYIGSKILLLDKIRELVLQKAPEAHSFCDLFSGTACVARYFKSWYEIYSNDLLDFSYCLQRGTIEVDSLPGFSHLKPLLVNNASLNLFNDINPIDYLNNIPEEELEKLPRSKRLFQNNYSPSGGRMYVTDINALRIDYTRNKIDEWHHKNLINEDEYFYLLACHIEGIPFVSNISGTYGAFHKTWDPRAKKKFELQKLPVITNGKKNKCYREDGVELVKKIQGDILYMDPPYNKRQYLPNYHVLETDALYDFPSLTGITGIRPYEDKKSDFCNANKALIALENIIKHANFTHIILSYNTEGIMPLNEIENIMKAHGDSTTFEAVQIPYRRYKSHSGKANEDLKELLIYVRKAK